MPPTFLILLVAGWLFLPGSPLVWTLVALLPSALPLVVQTIQQGRHPPGHLTLKQRFEPIRLPFLRWVLALLFLPYEALFMLDAIRVTISRLLFVRRHMLQWKTAAHFARSIQNSRTRNWLEMAGSTIFVALMGIVIWMINPPAVWVAAPFLIGWFISPQVAYWISQPSTRSVPPLTEAQHRQIQRLARRTWAFFERFSGPDDHWLPPDHFQETPRGNVVHMTTPTNIGLLLVSTLSAYDLGYMGLLALAVRLRSNFESMDRLEHYRGHLLNWYDTQTLNTLLPRYISTVDSGNLAACLITLKQGCLALTDAPLVGVSRWQGLLVILDILSEALQALEKNNPKTLVESLEDRIDRHLPACERHPGPARRLDSHPDLALRSSLGGCFPAADETVREPSPCSFQNR